MRIALAGLLALFGLLAAPALAAPTLQAEIMPRTLPLGDTVTLTVILVQESAPTGNQLIETPPAPELDLLDFRLLSQSAVQNIGVMHNSMRLMATYTYLLQPMRPGTLTIPALNYPIRDGNTTLTLRTEPLTVTVQGSWLQAPQLIAGGLLLLFVGGISAIVFWLWRRSRRQSVPLAAVAPIPATITPLPEALSALTPTPEALEGVLTELLTSRWGINSSGKTLDEIQALLQTLPEGHSQAHLIALNCLEKLYAIRYRPYPASPQELTEIQRLLTGLFHLDPHEQVI
jgi:hypothetical protein